MAAPRKQPQDQIPHSWPGPTAAAVRLGIRPPQFRRLVADGEIAEHRRPDGTVRFDPDELDALAKELSGMPDDAPPTGGVPADGMRAGTDLVRQAQSHVEKMLKLTLDGFASAAAASKETNEQLLAELRDARKTHLDMVVAREQALSEAHEREQLATHLTETRAMKMGLIEQLKPNAQAVISAIAARIAGEGKEAAANATIQLLQTLHPGQIEALKASGFLEPEQAKLVDQILAAAGRKEETEEKST
jgi:hypothetical protein